jgi:hypothetical protein
MSIIENNIKRFYCNKCSYGTNKKSSYDDHIMSLKHNRQTHSISYSKPHTNLECQICNAYFKSRSGLWKHNKTCITNNKVFADPIISDDLFTNIVKTTVIEVIKHLSNND